MSCLSEEQQTQLKNAKILLVGSGGIGCEVLQNLVGVGVRDVAVIDLDTIDLSNLHRQFLFRRSHIGKTKADTACEVVRSFVPESERSELRLRPTVTNVITDSTVSVEYLQSFTLVINALDNIPARRHINRLAVGGSVPLLECGSAGLLGQTAVHVPPATACYECAPLPTPTSFAVCTIRSTPSKPIHVVVWAKERALAPFLEEEEEEEEEATTTKEQDGGASKEEPADAAAPDIADGAHSRGDAIRAERAAIAAAVAAGRIGEALFRSYFGLEVLVKRALAEMEKVMPWTETPPPTPFRYDELVTETPGAETMARLSVDDQKVWSVQDAAALFVAAGDALAVRTKARLSPTAESSPPQCPLVFDKDDMEVMQFVAAAASLRLSQFDIAAQSAFQIRAMAGNIVPAVATTNAVIAGLVVIEALKLIFNGVVDTKDTEERQALLARSTNSYLNKHWSAGRKIALANVERPNPECYVCAHPAVSLTLNPATITLGTFVRSVLKQHLHFTQPSVTVGDTNLVYEEGEDLEEDEVARYRRAASATLASLGVQDGVRIDVEDFAQDMQVNLLVKVDEVVAGGEGMTERDGVVFRMATSAADAVTHGGEGEGDDEDESASDSSELLVVTSAEPAGTPVSPSRKRPAPPASADDDVTGPAAKAARVVIVLDD
jgi:ubiquitin-like 1-activating enzyme E1 B